MKDYYETKKARYEYILAALDAKIKEDLQAVATDSLDELIAFLSNLKDTRELITSEIDYLNERLAEMEKAEQKVEETTEKEAE